MEKDILLYSRKRGVTDAFRVEVAKSIADRDYIMERANRCSDNKNKLLIESLITEDEEYPVFTSDEVDKTMDLIMKDEWIATVYEHYGKIKGDKTDEPKYLEEALKRTVSKLANVPVEHISVKLGWYLLVIDINLMFKNGENQIPAYLHMGKKVEGTWSNCGIFKRGH